MSRQRFMMPVILIVIVVALLAPTASAQTSTAGSGTTLGKPSVPVAVPIAVTWNGAPLDLDPPAIHAVVGYPYPHAPRHVLIPVRQLFEELGWAVEAHTKERFSSVQLRKPGWHYVLMRTGEKFLRVHDYTTPLPVPVALHKDHLYAPMLVLRVIAGARLRYDHVARRLTIHCNPPDPAPQVAIGDITANLDKWLHQRVTINAMYVGPEGDGAFAATSQGRPVTAAFAFLDDTGAIYCTQCVVVSALYFWDASMASRAEAPLTGSVRLGHGDVPYLSLIRAR